MISTPLRRLLLVLLAPIACTFPVKSGDNYEDDSTEDSAAQDPGPTGEPTTGQPAFCGDGVVDVGEGCDDGNDDPNDGCDAACVQSEPLTWTYAPADIPFANDLAVDPSGRIVFVSDQLVVALAVDGTELWRKSFADSGAFGAVDIDEAGTIYVAGEVGTVHSLTPDGDELWRSDTQRQIKATALGTGRSTP